MSESSVMFEKATRQRLRWESIKGALSVEDLWGLPLTASHGLSLDVIAVGLNREIKDGQQESFVQDLTAVNEQLQLKFNIAKYIIDTRKAEQKVAADLVARRQKKEKLVEILGKKQDAQLEGMSAEDLQKMIAEL